MKDKNPDSPYGIICADCGKQGLTEENYDRQMSYPDSLWKCPICGCSCYWDDERYEAKMFPEEKDDDN